MLSFGKTICEIRNNSNSMLRICNFFYGYGKDGNPAVRGQYFNENEKSWNSIPLVLSCVFCSARQIPGR